MKATEILVSDYRSPIVIDGDQRKEVQQNQETAKIRLMDKPRTSETGPRFSMLC